MGGARTLSFTDHRPSLVSLQCQEIWLQVTSPGEASLCTQWQEVAATPLSQSRKVAQFLGKRQWCPATKYRPLPAKQPIVWKNNRRYFKEQRPLQQLATSQLYTVVCTVYNWAFVCVCVRAGCQSQSLGYSVKLSPHDYLIYCPVLHLATRPAGGTAAHLQLPIELCTKFGDLTNRHGKPTATVECVCLCVCGNENEWAIQVTWRHSDSFGAEGSVGLGRDN